MVHQNGIGLVVRIRLVSFTKTRISLKVCLYVKENCYLFYMYLKNNIFEINRGVENSVTPRGTKKNSANP